MSLIHDPALHQLRHALRGRLYDPGEPEYEDACTLFNAMVQRRPRKAGWDPDNVFRATGNVRPSD